MDTPTGVIVHGHLDEPVSRVAILGASDDRAELLAAIGRASRLAPEPLRLFHALAWSIADPAAAMERYTIWAKDLDTAQAILLREVGDSGTSLWDVRRSEDEIRGEPDRND